VFCWVIVGRWTLVYDSASKSIYQHFVNNLSTILHSPGFARGLFCLWLPKLAITNLGELNCSPLAPIGHETS
jgi:hypothetical protein